MTVQRPSLKLAHKTTNSSLETSEANKPILRLISFKWITQQAHTYTIWLHLNIHINMSLELKLQSGGNGDKFHLHGGDLQGFVCFTWTSPFQKYVDFCNLISKFYYCFLEKDYCVYTWGSAVVANPYMGYSTLLSFILSCSLFYLFLFSVFLFCVYQEIQVTLEGYLVTNPSNKLTSGKKFYSSEILCVRGESPI